MPTGAAHRRPAGTGQPALTRVGDGLTADPAAELDRLVDALVR
ncbi:hypothetical protein [Micromonospora sp. DT47]